ncbi:hypothetical protein EB796_007110 [Bugula neritina]|uniref:Uncharacterized protein n=1 Tax=Bugula neritina TaxID=10212 RepID=A0A7J7K7H1_BUGNE|nr:hypothetical protein EB796_007110 [Bugula neritina]
MSLPPLTKERSSLLHANPAEREAPHSASNQYYTTPVTTPDHLYAGPVPQVPDSQRPNILQSQQDVYLKGQGQSADGYLTPEAKLPDGYIDIVEEEADGGYETIPTDN